MVSVELVKDSTRAVDEGFLDDFTFLCCCTLIQTRYRLESDEWIMEK